MGVETSRLAITGAKWVAIGSLAQKALRFVLIVVLARLLTPDDFGLIATASLVLALAGRVKQLGFHGALLQRRTEVEEAANAYFYLNTATVAITYAAILAIAPLAAWYFKDDRILLVVDMAALRLLAEAASAVQRSLTVRDLDFRKLTVIQLAETFLSSVVAITLAAMGHGVWSMVWGMVAGAVFASSIWWVTTPWLPTRAWSWPVARQMLSFGADLWSISNLSYLIESASRFFIGRFLGVLQLGYYEFTNRIIHGPTGALVEIGNRIALPAFCREQDDVDRVGRWYLRMTGYTCLITAPFAATLLLLADVAVPVVFGEQWVTTVPLVRALALFVFACPLIYAWPVYVSTGKPRTLMAFTVVRFVVTVPLLFLAARQSLLATCLVESVTVALLAPLNLYLVARIISVRAGALLRILLQPLVGAAAFSLTALAMRRLAGDIFPEPTLLSLVVFFLPAAVAYAGAIMLVRPGVFGELGSIAAVALGLSSEDA